MDVGKEGAERQEEDLAGSEGPDHIETLARLQELKELYYAMPDRERLLHYGKLLVIEQTERYIKEHMEDTDAVG